MKTGNASRLQRIKSILYDAVLHIVTAFKDQRQSRTLLLVRTNNIGDYILWRDALPLFKVSERFKDYHITLLGNVAWKGLFEALDTETVDDAIWMNPSRFKRDLKYRYRLLRDVRQRGFDTVINTVYSRCKRVDDAFVIASGARYVIGQQSDGTNVFSYEVGYDKDLYDELFPDTASHEFEWLRSMRFAAYLTGIDISRKKPPQLPAQYNLPAELKDRDYFIVFPGTSSVAKKWDGKNFAEVTEHIVRRWGLLPVIGGSPSDKPYVDEFLQHYQGEAVNLYGKTSLLEFAGLAAQSHFLLSIDTGSVHVAAFAGSRIFVMHNGSHYGRYYPYLPHINSKVYGIFPDEAERIFNANPAAAELLEVVYIDYNNITQDKVCRVIDDTLGRPEPDRNTYSA